MRQYYSFEEGIPAELKVISGREPRISTEHRRDGLDSLCWETEPGAALYFEHKIPFCPLTMEQINKAMDSFVLWVYSQAPVQGNLTIEFIKEKQTCCSFTFYLGFSGWRTAWVTYERDMKGKPQKDMDGFKITANVMEETTLFLDQLIPYTQIDPRYHIPDIQVPDIHKGINESTNKHWLALLKFWNQLKEGLWIEENGSRPDVEAINKIKSRFQNYLLEKNRTLSTVEALTERFKEYEIHKGDGRPVSWNLALDAYPDCCSEALKALTNHLDFRSTGILLREMAFLWHSSDEDGVKKAMESMVTALFLHVQNHGYACGSGLGTTHHSGYQMREFCEALFLMREVLEKEHLLQAAADTVCWFCGSGRVFGSAEDIRLESLDTFNTLSQGILAGILMQKEYQAVHNGLLGIQRWLGSCMLPAPGLEGPFKSDHSMFHHANHYPAYAMGGLTGVIPVVYCISRTGYRLPLKAHQSLRNAVLAFRLYCNHLNWPVSMAARHPTGVGEHSGIGTLTAFQYLALAGNLEGNEELDREVAAAYMRLRPFLSETEETTFPVSPEPAPNGHWNFNYGCVAVHRRDQWMASVRGFSRYIWGNESYLANNLYGRYLAYGQLQLLTRGNPISNKESGFVHDGWDWNFWPGTTAIALPFEQLRSDVRNVDTCSGFEEMLISDETYCGGTNLEGNGVFALKLHEHGKYEGSHRARKSYFFIEDMIVCLGSDIENNSRYPTFTTLFQTHVKDGEGIFIQGESVTSYPWEKKLTAKEPLYLADTKGNGYYIPSGQQIEIKMGNQISCSQSDGSPTQGLFARAAICHGTEPEKQEYEYAVMVEGAGGIQERFREEMPYEILQKDFQAHIVRKPGTNEIYYAFFEPVKDVAFGFIKSVDTPCLLIEKQEGDKKTISVCDPDLRLYEGTEADQVDENGTQVEVSIYSRTWMGAESKHHRVTITLADGSCHGVDCSEGRPVILSF